MTKDYHIIGVGTVGLQIALNLKSDIIHLWDNKIIKKSDNYLEDDIGKPKVLVAANMIERKYPTKKVIIHEDNATNYKLNKYTKKFVIDCCDTKSKSKIISNMRVSWDGPLLNISDGTLQPEKIDTPYYYRKSKIYAKRAATTVIQNLHCNFNYINYKCKLYRLSYLQKYDNKLIFSSKQLRTFQGIPLNNSIVHVHTDQFNKSVKQLQKENVETIIYSVTFLSKESKMKNTLNLPMCTPDRLIKTLQSVTNEILAYDYVIHMKGTIVKDNKGYILLDFYHVPTGG